MKWFKKAGLLDGVFSVVQADKVVVATLSEDSIKQLIVLATILLVMGEVILFSIQKASKKLVKRDSVVQY